MWCIIRGSALPHVLFSMFVWWQTAIFQRNQTTVETVLYEQADHLFSHLQTHNVANFNVVENKLQNIPCKKYNYNDNISTNPTAQSYFLQENV